MALLLCIQLLLLVLQCSAEGIGVETTSSAAISSPTVSSSPDSDSRRLKFIIIGLLCGAAVLSVIVAVLLSIYCRERKRSISDGEDIVIANKILDKWEGVHPVSNGPGKMSWTTTSSSLDASM